MRPIIALVAASLLLVAASACSNTASGSVMPTTQSQDRQPQSWPPM